MSTEEMLQSKLRRRGWMYARQVIDAAKGRAMQVDDGTSHHTRDDVIGPLMRMGRGERIAMLAFLISMSDVSKEQLHRMDALLVDMLYDKI